MIYLEELPKLNELSVTQFCFVFTMWVFSPPLPSGHLYFLTCPFIKPVYLELDILKGNKGNLNLFSVILC